MPVSELTNQIVESLVCPAPPSTHSGNMVRARVGCFIMCRNSFWHCPQLSYMCKRSYTCRNDIQGARNCPTLADRHWYNCPTVQELYADCQKASHNCRKYSCTVLHVQELFLYFHNISKPAGTILNFSYTCRCENCS